jgi:hypothetical protein
VNVTSRRVWRGAFVALAIGALSAVPAAADVSSEPEVEQSEAIWSELSAPAPAILLLEPQCSRDGLRRFAVEHAAGPATQFAVSVGETPDVRNMAIGVGETLQFWVEAAESDRIKITWPDGAASSTPVDQPCVADGNVYGAPGRAPELAVSPAPTPSADPTPSDRPSPTPAPDDTAARVTTGSSGDPSSRVSEAANGAAAAGDAAINDRGKASPRPRPSGGAIACPDGLVPVDSDSDGQVEMSDRCQDVIETASEGRVAGSGLTVAALAVTLALLLTSIGVGAVSRHRS